MIDIKPGERVVLEVRRHWYVLFIETAVLILFFAVPIGVLAIFLAGSFPLGPKIISLSIFLKSAWLLVGWIVFFVVWTNYYLDVWIVTDKRMIDVEQHHLFDRDISEFGLDKIQDITVEVSGLLPTLLHFGNIHVQTAGESRSFIIRHVPHPDKVKDAIFKQHDEFVRAARGEGEF